MQKPTPRIFSGMQPTGTGELHIGNYLGALKNWIELAQAGEYDALYCVVDAHAATAEYDAKEMPERIFGTALSYLAAGLDPEKCTIFIQSAVPAHMELTWYLSTVTPMGDLHRMTQFKEKSDQHKLNINAGLFTYPILMAADILIYKATASRWGTTRCSTWSCVARFAAGSTRDSASSFPSPCQSSRRLRASWAWMARAR